MKRTFEISLDGRSIACLVCKRISHNWLDVRQRYCGHCEEYHDDRALRNFLEERKAVLDLRVQPVLGKG